MNFKIIRFLVMPIFVVVVASQPRVILAADIQGASSGQEIATPGITSSIPKSTSVSAPVTPKENLFAEEFFMKPGERVKRKTLDINGLMIVETPRIGQSSQYSVVTDFGKSAVRMREIPGVTKPEEVRKWIEDNVKSADYQGVEVRAVKFPLASRATSEGSTKPYFWVGHRGFTSVEEAKRVIDSVKNRSESRGRKFNEVLEEASTAAKLIDQTEPVEIKTKAQFKKEEELMLKFLDQMDIGNEIFGPLQGSPAGEPITWQSFGETTWRKTNFDVRNFSDQVGYWTNRLIFRGIRAPFDTINPYVEATGVLESHGQDFASFIDFYGGLEWRPFSKNEFFLNYQPWSLPLLAWVRNYRFYVQYGDRKNLKDEITGSKDYDLIAGVSIFYEFNIDPPALAEGVPSTVADYLRRYVWGEYYGNYRYEKTNFGGEDHFDAFIWNSAVLLGFKMPGVPLPPNPINDKIVIMPYMKFEHVNNTEFSFHYQNRYFVGAGARWMPFANYRWKDNEWLGKTKIFVEYLGIGDAKNIRQNKEVPDAMTYDLRFGVAFSQKRY